jgi:hypothetical protein
MANQITPNSLIRHFGLTFAYALFFVEIGATFLVRFFVLLVFVGITGLFIVSSFLSFLSPGTTEKIVYASSPQKKADTAAFLSTIHKIGDNRALARTAAESHKFSFTLPEYIIDPYAHRIAQIEHLESLLSQSPRSVPVLDALLSLYDSVNDETSQKRVDELKGDREFILPTRK